MDGHRNRKKNRLRNYDYSRGGYYFVTICTKDKREWFGEIEDGEMKLSEIGNIVEQCWREIPQHFPNVELDEYVIMPNHVHGIIVINNEPVVGVQNFEPLRNEPSQKTNKFQHIIPGSLGSIIRGFKTGVTKWCRNHNYNSFQWQRNFYDHIIRDDRSLYSIRQYILENPFRWHLDRDNPGNQWI